MNSVNLTGRITSELALKYTDANVATVAFNLAVQQEFKTNGEYLADFPRIVLWREQAENLVKFKNKGDWIEVYGALRTRSYDKDGYKKFITEVHGIKVNFPPIGKDRKEEAPKKREEVPTIDVTEDDLPF